MTDTPAGKLIVVSGPSGAGKTTVLKEVFRRFPGRLVASVSATTRARRPGEVDGRDYHFLSPEEFESRRQRGEFLECCEVYRTGDWYGTLLAEVTPRLAEGKWVVLEIDVQGTLAVLRRHPEAITIFVRPSSIDQLERRLRERGTEDEEKLRRRLTVAAEEWTYAGRYQHQVVNDDLPRAVEEICTLLASL